MDWIYISLRWYTALFILGIIFFPLTKKMFARFLPDQGYAFAKTLAILFLSYASFVLGIAKLLPFTQAGLIFLIFLIALFNFFLFKRNNNQQSTINNRQSIPLIIFEELLFLGCLIFWAFIRGQEPSIRGLEKFMDFGFINSILRSKYFPPLDMWYSAEAGKSNGYYINYYYFGHLTGALLIKLTGIKSAIGYNLILATTFALTVIQSFSLAVGIVFQYQQKMKQLAQTAFETGKLIFFGLLGSFIVSLAGNLHTIYVFTLGYPNENPVPFWGILSWYNPSKYWYPNATRFIPNTIHEFPSYSWVVADMHGHVFDIPFILLTLAILFIIFIHQQQSSPRPDLIGTGAKIKSQNYNLKLETAKNSFFSISLTLNLPRFLTINYQLLTTIFLGFLTAVHYMTNAFDGPIYILLTVIIFFYLYKITKTLLKHIIVLVVSFVLFSLPFSLNFKPFVSGIGVNCSPNFLLNLKKFGPFLFEKGNCQISPIWMLFVLWGFFWINLIIFLIIKKKQSAVSNQQSASIDQFILILFLFGTFLIIIPEFFYIKDIYPAHFRANTMFKMGYQAFIMLGFASTYTFFKIKLLTKRKSLFFSVIFVFFFFFIAIYPLFSIPSYYGQLDRPVELDGSKWLNDFFPEDKEIIDFINDGIENQPTILEAQGDSYTDFDRISAYTGLPTVAGWWVHEWLWRGSAEVVGERIPDIVNIYESDDIELTKALLKKYKVSYIIVSKMEAQKYPNLKKDKFKKVGTLIFQSTDGQGALYQVNL